MVSAISRLDDEELEKQVKMAITRASAVVRELNSGGPDRERNTYTLHPRGTVVCAGGGDEKAALVTQCVLSAMAGNRLIIPVNSENVCFG